MDLFTLADKREISQIHSPTSLKAAQRHTESGRRQSQCEQIKEWIIFRGTDGGTIREVSNQFGLGMNICSARMRDLETNGQVIKTAQERISPGSDDPGSVYVITGRWLKELGLGTTKATMDGKSYRKVKDALESYASGLNDNGLKAREILQEVDPTPGDRFA